MDANVGGLGECIPEFFEVPVLTQTFSHRIFLRRVVIPLVLPLHANLCHCFEICKITSARAAPTDDDRGAGIL